MNLLNKNDSYYSRRETTNSEIVSVPTPSTYPRSASNFLIRISEVLSTRIKQALNEYC